MENNFICFFYLILCTMIKSLVKYAFLQKKKNSRMSFVIKKKSVHLSLLYFISQEKINMNDIKMS